MTPWQRRFVVAAGVLGALAVAAGAFGAHLLAARLEPRLLDVWDTAARYHAVHAVALLAACAAPLWRGRLAVAACAMWVGGIVLFSGSLYLLAVTGSGWLGAVTPIGGLALIGGWLVIALAAARAAR